jgi:Rhodopirellula transposase DDE domain
MRSFSVLPIPIGIPLKVAHYPPYCSKYTPIEHWVFSHLTRAAQAIVFYSLETAHHAYAQTTTTQGLTVEVRTSTILYQSKQPIADDFHDTKNIIPDPVLGRWNYTVFPRQFR